MALPGFKVIPYPHPDDKPFNQECGENWYSSRVDISGALHELLSKYKLPT
jgi:hypothetical protein